MIRFAAVVLIVVLAITCDCVVGKSQQLVVLAQDDQPASKLTVHTIRLQDKSDREAVKLDQLKFLTGEWRGEGLGMQADEMWSSPFAGTMLGTFRLVKDDKLVFTEFFVLEKDGESFKLKLKHFDDKFAGWEAKDKSVDFKLIRVENNTAWFDGMTYQRMPNGNLNVWVAMKKKDGSYREGEFVYRPVKSK